MAMVFELLAPEDAPESCWGDADVGRYVHKVWADNASVLASLQFANVPTGQASVVRSHSYEGPANVTTWTVTAEGQVSTFSIRETEVSEQAHEPFDWGMTWMYDGQAYRMDWHTQGSTYYYETVIASAATINPPLLAAEGTAPFISDTYQSRSADASGTILSFEGATCDTA